MKTNLANQAQKIKEKLLEEVTKYCKKTVTLISDTYAEMEKQIMHDPKDERELVQTRGFIAAAPGKVDELS